VVSAADPCGRNLGFLDRVVRTCIIIIIIIIIIITTAPFLMWKEQFCNIDMVRISANTTYVK
jgi:hypothetical protein